MIHFMSYHNTGGFCYICLPTQKSLRHRSMGFISKINPDERLYYTKHVHCKKPQSMNMTCTQFNSIGSDVFFSFLVARLEKPLAMYMSQYFLCSFGPSPVYTRSSNSSFYKFLGYITQL